MSNSPEALQEHLEAEINTAIGSNEHKEYRYGTVAKILSYFPSLAEKFIDLQNQANLSYSLYNHGIKDFHLCMRKGEWDKEISDQFPEALEILGFTDTINCLRRKDVYPNFEILKRILSTKNYQLQPGDEQIWAVRKKTLEVLQVTPAEYNLIGQSVSLIIEVDENEHQAEKYESKAQNYHTASDLKYEQVKNLIRDS
jgi:hypothetical protein